MKTIVILISISSLCTINAATLKRTKGLKTTTPTTTTTDAGFVAKYFHIPEFLKFSQNEKPSDEPTNAIEPQQSRLSKILDSINIFKKSKQFGEPYLRAYIQPDGSYKWYFVYPGQMLYPAPDQFSIDLQRTSPTTTTTTTTTTEPPAEGLDGTPKPLYPLMGKIEYVKNETEPKENEWAINILNSGPIFQPYGKIQPPFDEPLRQQMHNGKNQGDQEDQDEPVEENQSAQTNRNHKTLSKTSKPTEHAEAPEQQSDEPAEEEDQPAAETEEAQEDGPVYENDEADENEPPADENNPDEEDTAQDDEQVAGDKSPSGEEPAQTEPPKRKASLKTTKKA